MPPTLDPSKRCDHTARHAIGKGHAGFNDSGAQPSIERSLDTSFMPSFLDPVPIVCPVSTNLLEQHPREEVLTIVDCYY